MGFPKTTIALVTMAALAGSAQAAVGSGDSVRSWGRWAVIAPMAGDHPEVPQFRVVQQVGPGESSETTPKLALLTLPVDEEVVDEAPAPPEEEELLPVEAPVAPEETVVVVDPIDEPAPEVPVDDIPVDDTPVDDPVEPPVVEPKPITFTCDPGTSCGFGTVAPLVTSGLASAEVTNPDELTAFRFSSQGDSFEIELLDGTVITSRIIDLINPAGDIFLGTAADENGITEIFFSALKDGNGDIFDAQGTYIHNEQEGFFVWGVSAGLDEIDALSVGQVVATYAGASMFHLAPTEITVDFGQSSWDASVNGGPFSFTANGVLTGPDLITEGFSDNVDTPLSGMRGFVVTGTNTVNAGWDVTDVDGQKFIDVVRAIGAGDQ